jgi:hypothetical protein
MEAQPHRIKEDHNVTDRYISDIVLGDEYEDTQTAFRGIATAIYFYQYGCERVQIEAFDKKASDIRSLAFDAPRLRHVESGKVAKVTRTGGPGNGAERRSDAGAMR